MYKIGVFGSAGGREIEKCKEFAFDVGKFVAINNGILCTGACPGLPHEAALGAKSEGGLILGFSPGMNLIDHAQNYKFPVSPYILIFTGMEKKGRNLISTRTCDAGIFMAGSWGTVNEFTFMRDEGEIKVIGLLAGSGGFVDGIIIPNLDKTYKPTKAIIIVDDYPSILVNKIFQQLAKIKPL